MPFCLQFDATDVTTSPLLTSLLTQLQDGSDGDLLLADLSLGSWTPQALAMQLLGQLQGCEMQPKRWRPGTADTLGHSMSVGVDEEGRGNWLVRTAHALKLRIAKAVGERRLDAIILVPCFGNVWRSEDKLLLEYLRAGCPGLRITLAAVDRESAAWPAEWRLHTFALPALDTIDDAERCLATQAADFIPSALSPRMLKALHPTEGISRLRSGWAVVGPERRRRAIKQGGLSAEIGQAFRAGGLTELVPFALLHGPSTAGADAVLHREAWASFAAGARDLAVQFMAAAALRASDPVSLAFITAHHMVMLVAMARYAEAYSLPEPPLEQLPEKERGLLLKMRGWALVMDGKGQEARVCLNQALALNDPTREDAEHLLLMNITALSELRSGDHQRAYILEKQIEAVLQQQASPDERLVFVNSLNLARLYRYKRDWESAEHRYRRAFATAEGCPSDTDRVNEELCRGRLAEDREDWATALDATFRAALYWVAADCPEALNWRVQSLLLGKHALKVVHGLHQLHDCVESLADAFHATLERLTTSAGLTAVLPRPGSSTSFRFHRDGAPLPPGAAYLAGPHWALLATPHQGPAHAFGSGFSRLTDWLASKVAIHHGVQATTFLIPRNDGCAMPRNFSAMRQQAATLGISRVRFSVHDLPGATGYKAFTEVRQSPLVQRTIVDDSGTVVTFRRYLQPCLLSPVEAKIHGLAKAGATLEYLHQQAKVSGLESSDVQLIVEGLRSRCILSIAAPPKPSLSREQTRFAQPTTSST